MKYHSIKTIAALLGAALLFVACGKDNADLLVGQWTNTAQSYEITIAGQEYIPEGYICMEFTNSKVWISDYRTDCYATWNGYTLTKKDGKQLLEIDGGCYAGRVFVIEKLTNDKLVLASEHPNIDMDFKYIMKRYDSPSNDVK
ncbi:MAG: hypothetical protein IKR33_06080 [Bacteroidales bacterium]|nr:hypothetical protein [Bacteroidales bacterium]